jgi:lipopolysaccharide export system protein LptA
MIFLFTCVQGFCGPATITSDRMRVLSKGEINEFIGHVKLDHENLIITSDEMKAEEKSGLVSAKGNLEVIHSSGTVKMYVWGDRAEYNRNTGSGYVTGEVRAKRNLRPDTTETIDLTCERLEIYDAGERLTAIKKVIITQSGSVARGDKAYYEHRINRIKLFGSPASVRRIDGTTVSEYNGDIINIDLAGENVSITGNVKTKIILK